jgi:hypothetical protein
MKRSKTRVIKTLNFQLQIKPLTSNYSIIGWTIDALSYARNFIAEKLKKHGRIKYIMVDESLIAGKEMVRGELICVSEEKYKIIARAVIYAHFNGNLDITLEYMS